MKKNMSSLEDQYVELAIGHHELLMAGDPDGSNRCHKRLLEVAKGIRELSHGGKDILVALTSHDHPSVRLWAACHLLTLDQKLALSTLKEVAVNSSKYPWQLQTDAEMTIKEWKAGRLDPDWFLKKKK